MVPKDLEQATTTPYPSALKPVIIITKGKQIIRVCFVFVKSGHLLILPMTGNGFQRISQRTKVRLSILYSLLVYHY